MSRDVEIAVSTLTELLGHHTAHLDLEEQIAVALRMAKECNGMAAECLRERDAPKPTPVNPEST